MDIESFIQNMFGMSMDDYSNALEDAMKSKTLGYKKLSPDAVDPKYNFEKDSGFDLHSVEDIDLCGMSRAMVGTGLAFNIPDGYEIQVRPKSGLAINYGLTVLNTPSTIDGGYVGRLRLFFSIRQEKLTRLKRE